MNRRISLDSQTIDLLFLNGQAQDPVRQLQDQETEENSRKFQRILQEALREVIAHDLSSCQKRYICEYFYQQKTMRQIAEEYGVNISTVSRTIERGKRTLLKQLRYIMRFR